MKDITYATKCWAGDWDRIFTYHPDADIVYGNNMEPEQIEQAKKNYGKKFVYIGETDAPYYYPERYAVDHTKTKYILWYAGDVVPPYDDWLRPALLLLESYPIVSPYWGGNWAEYVQGSKREENGFEETDWGCLTHFFSDQAYVAKTKTMQGIDYNVQHEIGGKYPAHGGESFEKRVAMWLAATGNKRATLREYTYRHTPREHK